MGPLVLVSVVFPVNVIANPIMYNGCMHWVLRTKNIWFMRTLSEDNFYQEDNSKVRNKSSTILKCEVSSITKGLYRGAKLKWNDIYFALCHIDLYPMYFIRIISNWPKTLEISTKSTQYYLVEHIESRCILHYCNI